jgi:hypothetical protein
MSSNGILPCTSVFASGAGNSAYFLESDNGDVGITSVVAGPGIAVNSASVNNPIVSNTGVLSVTAGTGVVVSGTASAPVISTSPAVTATTVTASGTVQASNIVLQPSPAAGAMFMTGVAYDLFTPATDGIYLVNVSMETGSINVIVASCIVSVAKKSPIGPLISMITPLATPAGVSFSLTGGTAGPFTYNQTVSVTQTTGGAGNGYGGVYTIAKLCQNTLF